MEVALSCIIPRDSSEKNFDGLKINCNKNSQCWRGSGFCQLDLYGWLVNTKYASILDRWRSNLLFSMLVYIVATWMMESLFIYYYVYYFFPPQKNIPISKRCWPNLFLNISMEVLFTTHFGSLFHLSTIWFIKKHSVLSILTLWPLRFIQFLRIGSVDAGVNKLSGSVALNPFSILKYYINLPLNRHVVNENKLRSFMNFIMQGRN